MKKIQPEGSEPKRGWPSKKDETARSGKVFSLDFLFIEQAHAAEAAKQVSYRSLSVRRGPADACRYARARESVVYFAGPSRGRTATAM